HEELLPRLQERLARPRILVRGRRPRPARDQAARAAYALADRRRRSALAHLRGLDRRPLGRQATDDQRPRSDGLRALRDLGTRVLAGLDGSLHLLEDAPLDRRLGLRRVLVQPRGMVLASDPAVDRA